MGTYNRRLMSMFFGKFWQSTSTICRLFPLNDVKRRSHGSLKISSHETPHWGGWWYKAFCHKSAPRHGLLSRIVVIFFHFYDFLVMIYAKKVLSWFFCDVLLNRYIWKTTFIITASKPISHFLGPSNFRCLPDEVPAIFRFCTCTNLGLMEVQRVLSTISMPSWMFPC